MLNDKVGILDIKAKIDNTQNNSKQSLIKFCPNCGFNLESIGKKTTSKRSNTKQERVSEQKVETKKPVLNDTEIKNIVTDAYKKTEDILNAHMDKLHEVAGYLIKYEKMSGETFEQIMNNTYVEEVEETTTTVSEENSTEE